MQHKTCMQRIRTAINDNCVHLFVDVCRRSRLRAVKVVRASMRSMERMLHDVPNVRVIHLVRDPRGVALSRVNLHESVRSAWTNSASRNDRHEMIVREAMVYCQTVVEDVRKRKILEQQYPGQIMTVVYDDVVRDPRRSVREIYEFLDLRVDESVYSRLNATLTVESRQKFVRTPFGYGQARIFGRSGVRASQTVIRTVMAIKTGGEIADQWLQVLTSQDLKRITRDCKEFYDSFDYSWTH